MSTKPSELIGVDLDLRRCHAWSNVKGRLCSNVDYDSLFDAIGFTNATLLVECASPIVYGVAPSALRNKLRWMIWNTWALGRLNVWYTVLCSPSSIWKHGHRTKELHKVLGLTGDNKDIRECRAMVALYDKHPGDWAGVEQYMEKL